MGVTSLKRWLTVVLSALIVCSAAAGTASAAANAPAVRVTLEGKALSFQAPPTIIGGKTFVEFRSLFKALGYTVDYVASSKTIKAQSNARKIEMKVGGTTALVNGAKEQVNGDLKLIGGRTMVGVRFIATLSGKTVAWNAQSRIVVITTPVSASVERAALFGVLDKLNKAEADGDASAYMSQFLPNAQMRADIEAGIREQFSQVQIRTTYVSRKIPTLTQTEAVVATTEEIRKAGGAIFFPDRRDRYEYHLRKDASGTWKVDYIAQVSSDWLDVNGMWSQEVQAPDEDKQAVAALLNAQLQAINDKDFDAYAATYVPSAPGAAEELADLKDLQASYRMSAKVERTAIVEYSGDQALLLASMLLDVTQDGETRSGRSLILIPVTKKDGKWLFAGTGDILLNEKL
uniref:Copper amine oxidase-like N-terminal domain-containing protein n=1 Tax=Cohnella candidum TaxID=2674991 RepID=A0A3G3K3F3_9BACL|nr:hypothetical protein EAV92_22535 [Cohnella candidum]